MTTFNNLSKTAQTEYAIQFVIMDAIEKGHTNKDELISYMSSSVFAEAVAGYKKLMASK